MKAIRYWRYGAPDVLELVTLDEPFAGPDEVRVRLKAAGVSPIDAKLRSGALAWASWMSSSNSSIPDAARVLSGPGDIE